MDPNAAITRMIDAWNESPADHDEVAAAANDLISAMDRGLVEPDKPTRDEWLDLLAIIADRHTLTPEDGRA